MLLNLRNLNESLCKLDENIKRYETIQEIINAMEEAEDYDDLYNAAAEIENEQLRKDVERGITICDLDGDDIDEAISMIINDHLDEFWLQMNDARLSDESLGEGVTGKIAGGLAGAALTGGSEIGAALGSKVCSDLQDMRKDAFFKALKKNESINNIDTDWDSDVLYEIAQALNLDHDEYMMLVHDVNNLRGEEWLDDIEAVIDDTSLIKKFADIAHFDYDDESACDELDYSPNHPWHAPGMSIDDFVDFSVR